MPPVMLSVVRIVKTTRGSQEAGTRLEPDAIEAPRRGGRHHPPEGHASDSDDAGRSGDLDDCIEPPDFDATGAASALDA
jgi:hypothetical protein